MENRRGKIVSRRRSEMMKDRYKRFGGLKREEKKEEPEPEEPEEPEKAEEPKPKLEVDLKAAPIVRRKRR